MSAAGTRIAFSHLGCRANYAEIEELAAEAARRGWRVVDPGDPADVHVVNSCTVTAAADRQSRQLVRRLRRGSPAATVVLMGCFVDTHPDALAELPEVDLALANRNKMDLLDRLPSPGAAAVARPPGRSRAFLKVQDGCDHRCTYCVVWRARGPHRNIGAEATWRLAAEAEAAGLPEVVLSGIDLGALGAGDGDGVAELVERLLGEFSFRVRLSSINAQYLSDRLLGLLTHPRFCPQLHVPLQSGSDRVLAAMNRPHDLATFRDRLDRARSAQPDLALTTDLIAGFPGETEEEHRATIELATEMGMARLHVFPYSARAGTAAARRPSLPAETVARRAAELRELSDGLHRAQLARWRGRQLEVVWEDRPALLGRGLAANGLAVYAENRPGRPRLEMVLGGAPVRDGLRAVPLEAGPPTRRLKEVPLWNVSSAG